MTWGGPTEREGQRDKGQRTKSERKGTGEGQRVKGQGEGAGPGQQDERGKG